MTSKYLALSFKIALAIDIASCHFFLLDCFLPLGYAYYAYCIAQAITMAVLYYRISFQIEKSSLADDRYLRQVRFLSYIIVPFATKQILDELIRYNILDWLDYPVLLLTGALAYKKYYNPSWKIRVSLKRY